jgi:two-component system, HptB-dependent secretion and biofilm response regulator
VPSASPAAATADPARNRSALVVDADPASRLLLESQLASCGYAVAVATEGLDAVAQFVACGADVVFIDVHMSDADGIEAVKRIKAIAGHEFVPVIFVSGAGETASLERSIDAGGDDFVTKPVDERVLRAKLRAFERIRALHRSSARLHARTRADWEVAQTLLGEVVMGPNPRSSALRVDLMPTDTFSADIFLAEYCPSGDLNLLLGDFTGHGLAAALAAQPTAEIFRSMTAKGFAPQQILLEMNRKLKAQLPTGKFLAGVFVQVSRSLERLWVANCGMPEVLVLGESGVSERIRSAALPLGIQAEPDVAEWLRLVPIVSGQRLLLASDGVHEAVNPGGEQFGRDRLEHAAARPAGMESPALEIKRALDTFREGEPIPDDASLVEVRLTAALFEARQAPVCALGAASVESNTTGQWRMSIDLEADALKVSDPVPMLLSQLQEIPGLEEHRSALYTVLSELYCNALEHGVLQLNPQLKDLPEGFERYVAERERQLAALTRGAIHLSAVCVQWRGGGELTIRVQDSGSGFDWQGLGSGPPAGLHGRGLILVRGLCRSLRFENEGSCACATYAWGRPVAAKV